MADGEPKISAKTAAMLEAKKRERDAAAAAAAAAAEAAAARETTKKTSTATLQLTQPSLGVQQVEVVDVQMRFGSMVVFMIKWAFAAIPAIIIIGMVVSVLAGVFGGALAALGIGLPGRH